MTDERPDFGPSGYLPDRAARQARKIILRAPLGLHWLIAAVIFGVTLLVAGTVFLVTRAPDEPAPPFEGLISVTMIDRSGGSATQPSNDVLYVLVGAIPDVYADAVSLELRYCEATDHIEGADGRVWTVTGRGLGGTPSLVRHPATVWNGSVYVDRTTRIPGPPPSNDPAQPGC